ncbi:MauE/DoxX family redox-associated membrane protein [Chitinophaga sancti]|uniref:Methylamine utilisation protein MauE domain-containing protein n=1 Tax=Chitinophaga sancti TaxID=1004 RepID=A0A1K1T0V3_9BACT|nr:hypothetical protein SAMN05661012_06562 [Chitinophaga sancti]
MKRSVFVDCVAFLFVLLFIYTATSKFLDFSLFREQISESTLLAPFGRVIAWIVPISEIVISIMLLFPKWRIKGLYFALILMTFFTTYIILIMNFSKHIPCSCGGIISLLSWKDHLILNSAFLVLGALAIWISRHPFSRFNSSKLHL